MAKKLVANLMDVFSMAIRAVYEIKEGLINYTGISAWSTQSIANRSTSYPIIAKMVVSGKSVSVKLAGGFKPSRVFLHKFGYFGEGIESERKPGDTWNKAASGNWGKWSDRESLSWLAYFLEQLLTGYGDSSESKGKVLFLAKMIEVLKPTSLEISLEYGGKYIVYNLTSINHLVSGLMPMAESVYFGGLKDSKKESYRQKQDSLLDMDVSEYEKTLESKSSKPKTRKPKADSKPVEKAQESI